MNFQDALTLMQKGERVTRTCWKEKSKYATIHHAPHPRLKNHLDGRLCRNNASSLGVKGRMLSTWTPIENDILAEDWELVPEKHKMDWSFLDNLGDKETSE